MRSRSSRTFPTAALTWSSTPRCSELAERRTAPRAPLYASTLGHARGHFGAKRGIKPMIVRRGVAHGSGLGKVRWVVERAFAWLHQFKRPRIRYERRADLHQGLLELACSFMCLRRLRTGR